MADSVRLLVLLMWICAGTLACAGDARPDAMDQLSGTTFQSGRPGIENIQGHSIVLAAANGASIHASEHRVALVVGNSAYRQWPLANALNDARATAASLRRLGFDVILKENLKIRDIGGVYREFRSRITPGGVALVFYAGHGLQIKGRNFFPAIDSDIASEEDVPMQSLSLGDLLDNMDEAKSGVNLVFLDACRDNPFSRRFRSTSRGLAKVEAASGTLIHYATKPGSVADDGQGRHGVYTEALLAQIEVAGVPIEQVLKRVTNHVVATTRGRQEPWVEGSLRGDFYFNMPHSGMAKSPGPAIADPEATTWAAAESAGTAEAYRLYVDAYPKGKFVPAARIKLGMLTARPTQAQATPTDVSASQAPQSVATEDAETSMWNSMKGGTSKEALEAFLIRYPNGKYAAIAMQERARLDEQEKARRASELAEARARAEQERRTQIRVEEDMWDRAKSSNTPGSYADYLGLYPKGRYSDLALAARQKLQQEAVDRQRVEAERLAGRLAAQDRDAWETAKLYDTAGRYREYLKSFPQGIYAVNAAERVKQLDASSPPVPRSEFGPSKNCSANLKESSSMRVRMVTSLGTIILELNKTRAPVSVENFAKYVDSGHYNGTIFHQVSKGDVISGGAYSIDMKRKPTLPPIMNESANGLKNDAFTVAMARTRARDSATAQFFINLKANKALDYRDESPTGWGHAVFGKVIEGQEVIERIQKVATGKSGPFENVPMEPVVIENSACY